jgi:hypothetical protein
MASCDASEHSQSGAPVMFCVSTVTALLSTAPEVHGRRRSGSMHSKTDPSALTCHVGHTSRSFAVMNRANA